MKPMKIILGLLLLCLLMLPACAQNERWKKNMLLVYIPDNVQPCTALMNNAFSEWQANQKQKIQFLRTRVSRDIPISDIEVRFNSVSGEDAKNFGQTDLATYQSGSIKHGVITINYKDDVPPELAEANNAEIYRVMLHEVGLVVGLTPSNNTQSVMYNDIKEGQKILPEDIENLYTLYGWPLYRPAKKK